MAAAFSIDTIAKRSRLAPAKNPYFVGISGGRGGVSLGYRRPARGPGTWVTKLVLDGRRIEARLGQADDEGCEPGALSYPTAVTAGLNWAKDRLRAIDDERRGEVVEIPTVAHALEAYAAVHSARIGKPTSYMAGTFRRHVAPHTAFAGTRLDRVTEAKLQAWRKTLPSRDKIGEGGLTNRTINSILSQVRAALNHAAEFHRRSLPTSLPDEIRRGTRAVPGDRNARDKQVLRDADIRRLVDAAFVVDQGGDLGRLVLLLAATGARFSQVARLTVADVQTERCRIMMPPAKKGRRPKENRAVAVPVGGDVIARLQPALTGRRGHEVLLLRWHHKKVKGQLAWAPIERRPWPASGTARHEWAAAVAHAGLPEDTIMMCFRHSSIVRGLNAGLPVRLVAALHDTSVEMIEQHYSAFIVDATEELIRRALTPLAPTAAPHLSVDGASA